MQSSSSDTPATIFAFTSQSYRRAEADRILARWDGHDSRDVKLGYSDTYQSLGILKGVIHLAKSPAKGEGSLRVYLINEQIPLSKWDSIRPEHYLIANLRYSYPYDGMLSSNVNFIVYGIAAGKYRLKTVWDKAAPFAKEGELVCAPKVGDYESTASKLVTIRKGATAEGVSIECKQLTK
jgi:hypothetical protein